MNTQNTASFQENERHYSFGDSQVAAARLLLLARVFEKTTRVLLTQAGHRLKKRPERIADLGCGPGLTTELLLGVLGPERAFAFDASPSYVKMANARFAEFGEALAPQCHQLDLEQSDLPHGPFQLIYARHVLSHLQEPGAVLRRAHRSLDTRGLLVLEETTHLESEDESFSGYYRLVRALQEKLGQDTFVGRRLPQMVDLSQYHFAYRDEAETFVDPRLMAELHRENLKTLRKEEHVKKSHDPKEIDTLYSELDAVARGQRSAPPVRVGLVQLILERRAHQEGSLILAPHPGRKSG